ncbi:unnamed protein product, partial [Amoebophrya sp. A25]|eukprot:GSA25T00017225001.1
MDRYYRETISHLHSGFCAAVESEEETAFTGEPPWHGRWEECRTDISLSSSPHGTAGTLEASSDATSIESNS